MEFPIGIPRYDFISRCGKEMTTNLRAIDYTRRDGSRVLIPALGIVCDMNSSPVFPNAGREAAWDHDLAFRNLLGRRLANRRMYYDMRDWNEASFLVAGLFWLALTFWPFAYWRHWLRQKTRIGHWLFGADELRWILPPEVKADAERCAAAIAAADAKAAEYSGWKYCFTTRRGRQVCVQIVEI